MKWLWVAPGWGLVPRRTMIKILGFSAPPPSSGEKREARKGIDN